MPALGRLACLVASFSLLACCGLELSDETTTGDTAMTTTEDSGPTDESCSVDEDCTERGDVCGVGDSCVGGRPDLTTTCDESQASTFTGQPTPFFRGEICTVKGRDIPPAAAIPITVRTCHHACVTPGADRLEAQWDCKSDPCEAIVLAYSVSDGTDCPPEAWGEFPKEECVWAEYTTMGIGPIEKNGMLVETGLTLELPYFSNQDLQNFVDYEILGLAEKQAQASEECSEKCANVSDDSKAECLDDCLIKSLAFAYPQQADRVLPFDLRNTHDTPPDDCGDGDPRCECYTIGFG